MPGRDPNIWQALLGAIASAWPQLYAAGLAFVVALVRALHAGGRPAKSILEAVLCGCLTLALMPILQYFGLPMNLSIAAGGSIAFLGVEWLRDNLEALYDKIIGRWLK